MNRGPQIVYFDDEGFPVGLKANNAAETILGLRVSLPCPDGPIPAPGGTTAEFTFATVTVPGGLMGPKGQLRIWAGFSSANTVNSKTYRIKVGGNLIQTQSLANSSACDTLARVKNRATGVQVYQGTPSISLTTGAWLTLNVDTQKDFAIDITGQLGTAGEAFALEVLSVEIDPGY